MLGILFIGISAGIFIYRSQSTPGEHNPVPESSLSSFSPTIVPSVGDDDEILTNVKTKIKSALDNRTPAILLDVMTEKVLVTRYGTTCCGLLNRQQVPPQFSILQNAEGPWELESTIAATLLEKNKEDFEGTILSLSQNNYAVAVQLTSTDLIDEIILLEPDDVTELTQ